MCTQYNTGHFGKMGSGSAVLLATLAICTICAAVAGSNNEHQAAATTSTTSSGPDTTSEPRSATVRPDVANLVNDTAHDRSDAKFWYRLGEQYTAKQLHKEAIKAFQACYELSDSDEQGAMAMYQAAQNWAALGKFDDAMEALTKGMIRHPAIPELPWLAAFLSYQAGRHQAAADWARLATVHGCYNGTCPKRTGPEYPFARYEGPYDMLQWSLRAMGDSNGATVAQYHVEKAIKKREQAYGINTQIAADHQDISEKEAELISSVSEKGNKPRIGLGICTAKRPETFKRTYLSFRARCLDCNLIDDWYAVDDGSSDEQLADMKQIAPNIQWLDKPSDQSGHAGSVNTLLKVAAEYDYFVWLEDDWLFVKDNHLLSKAITVLKSNSAIGQVLFNQDYLQTDNEEAMVTMLGGDHYEASGVAYVMHKYCGPYGTEEYLQCSTFGKTSHYHWPHFSLQPGVWSMSHMTALGPVDPGQEFELAHALKYVERGLKTAFLPGANAVHLGKPNRQQIEKYHRETLEKHGIYVPAVGQSAYDLTGTSR